MKQKSYILIEGKAVKVGIDMNRVFPQLAGKKVPWVSLVHHDIVRTSDDIIRLYLGFAYYDLQGKFDGTHHEKVTAQVMEDFLKPYFEKTRVAKERNVLTMPHRLKVPRLSADEKSVLQERIRKDLGVPINLNLMINVKQSSSLN